ncbi:MAG: hypothetical protein KJ601_08295, partial [Nanoarchaeota archaeon]|nr:hypothetical protein [Nanoarchaeota archaeon]
KVIERYNENKKLASGEKKALYTSINKKMKALESIRIEKDNEFFINGADKIIPIRLKEAKQLIEEYSKKYDKVFISGSFLFSKEYNDIDIFIVRDKKYDEKWEDNRHLIWLTEKRLQNPVFQSAALISVSNFIIPNKIKQRPIKLGEFMSSYHEAVIEIRGNQDLDLTRYIVFTYYLKIKGRLLDGSELKRIIRYLTLDELDGMVKEILNQQYSEKYLYVEIHNYIKALKDAIKTERPNEHLIRCMNTYEELIYGKQRTKAEAH